MKREKEEHVDHARKKIVRGKHHRAHGLKRMEKKHFPFKCRLKVVIKADKIHIIASGFNKHFPLP